MDALILDGLLPAAVVQQITDWGFMDTGMDGKQHFHSSERFAAILSCFGQNGGNLNSAYDIIRKYGCVPFKFLPVTPNMTIADYFSPVPPHLLDIGKEFLALMGGKDFCQYQWLNDGGTTDIPAMSVAIADGPLLLGIPVNTGWNQVHPTVATGTPEHVVSCYSVPVPSADISDNYNPYLKVLDPGYQISYVIQLIVQYIPPPIPPTPPAPSFPSNPTPAQKAQWYDWLTKLAQWLGLIE